MSTNDIDQVRTRLNALESAVESINAERVDLTLKLLALHGERINVDGLLHGVWNILMITSNLEDAVFTGWLYDDPEDNIKGKGSVEGNALYTALVAEPQTTRFGITADIPYFDGAVSFTFNFGEINFTFDNITEKEILLFLKEQKMAVAIDNIVDERKELRDSAQALTDTIELFTSNGTAFIGPKLEGYDVQVMGGSFGYEEPEIFDGSFGGHQTQPTMPYPIFSDWTPLQDIHNTTSGAEDAIYNNIPEDVDVGMEGVSYWNMIDALGKNVADIINNPNATADGVLQHVERIKQQVENIKAEFEDKYMK